MKSVLGIIPARYNSSRLMGKPLADINGKPMLCWVYEHVKGAETIDEVVVATDDERIKDACSGYGIECIMTSPSHDTPTSRMYEVSKKMDFDQYVFIGGDEPMILSKSIDDIVRPSLNENIEISHGMTRILASPEVVDHTNTKVVTDCNGFLLYATRSPIPFPHGRLDFDYKKFVGVGSFSKKSLCRYNEMPKSIVEETEACDLIRFLELRIPVYMVEIEGHNVSVDTAKDLEEVRRLLKRNRGG